MKWRHAASPPSDGTWCWLNDGHGRMWIGCADCDYARGWRFEWNAPFGAVPRWFWIIELPEEAPPIR